MDGSKYDGSVITIPCSNPEEAEELMDWVGIDYQVDFRNNTIYISDYESAEGGHWEEVSDETTGEIYEIWVSENRSPLEEEIEEPVEEFVGEDDELYNSLVEQYDRLSSEKNSLKEQLKQLKVQEKDLRIAMEEELGPLYTSGQEAEVEVRAQYYGHELDEVESEIKRLRSELESVERKTQEANEKILTYYF